jgi:hypothetical protein
MSQNHKTWQEGGEWVELESVVLFSSEQENGKVTPEIARKYVGWGLLPAARIGRSLRVRQSDVERWQAGLIWLQVI